MQRPVEPCSRYLCLACSLPQEQETCYNNEFPCMADFIAALPQTEREVIMRDAKAEGYTMIGAEDMVMQLNNLPYFFVTSDQREGKLSSLTQNNPIIPFQIAQTQNFSDQVQSLPHYHGRPSQYSSSKCPLSVLLSNLEKEKVLHIANSYRGKESQIKILDVGATLAGTIRHIIASAHKLPYHEKLLMHQHPDFWEFEVPRNVYTEKPVALKIQSEELIDLSTDLDRLITFMQGGKLKNLDVWDMTTFQYERSHYKEWFRSLEMDWRDFGIKEYVFKGTADLLLTLANTGQIVVGDFKRARFQKNSFDLQTATYALGIEQMASIHAPGYLLVLAINRYGNKPQDYNTPVMHIRLLQRDDILIKTAKLKGIFLHTLMASLIQDPSKFLKLRNKQRKIRISKYGDKEQKMHCEDLFTGSPCINHQNNMCKAVAEIIKNGGNLEDLLIEPFQPWA
ncbi:MAG: hypothetical protein MAG795_00405 [Candidatus Woesearchaeota archaeon]|nr:hypothetical protein [Candidatus Woesearchaeota archaeon]